MQCFCSVHKICTLSSGKKAHAEQRKLAISILDKEFPRFTARVIIFYRTCSFRVVGVGTPALTKKLFIITKSSRNGSSKSSGAAQKERKTRRNFLRNRFSKSDHLHNHHHHGRDPPRAGDDQPVRAGCRMRQGPGRQVPDPGRVAVPGNEGWSQQLFHALVRTNASILQMALSIYFQEAAIPKNQQLSV